MKMFDRKLQNKRQLIHSEQYFVQKLFHLPFRILFIITSIASIGFVMMYSAGGGDFSPWATKQIMHFIIFFPIMILIAVLDIRLWYSLSYFSYISCLLVLVAVLVFGHKAMGATRWITIGPFRIQPSEVMMICMGLSLARYFHNLKFEDISKLRFMIIPFLMIITPAILIAKQPDLGTAVMLLGLGGFIFLSAGVRLWKFGVIALAALTSMPIIWQFLKDYQKTRILTFISPERDPLGAGYNIIQSKIAIGSGGVFGKGLLKGSQSQLDFLPEHQTDFIFTMLAEEWGFAGGFIVISLYALLFIYSLSTAISCKNHFGRLLASGMASMIFLHVFINIAMVMGLIPVVGVPLPLLSYGGTIMMTTLAGFGLIINVDIHNKKTINSATKSLF